MKKHVKAKWLLEGKGCNDCDLKFQCKKEQETLLVCGKWKKKLGFGKVILPIVRKVMPSLVAAQLVSVQPMSAPTGTIFYMNHKNNKKKKGKNEKAK